MQFSYSLSKLTMQIKFNLIVVFGEIEKYNLFVQPYRDYEIIRIIFLQITGTGHGIGKELAIRYATLGATVVCWDLNQQGNEETVNEIKKMGTSTVYAYK